MNCPNCGSDQLSAALDTEVTATGVGDGRLKANEVRPMIVVGCDTCSETLAILRDPDIDIKHDDEHAWLTVLVQ
jgi:hypothetical protein